MESTALRMLRSHLLLTYIPAPETLAFLPWIFRMEGVEKQNRERRSAKHDAFFVDRGMNSETHLQTREKIVCASPSYSPREVTENPGSAGLIVDPEKLEA